MQIVITGHGNFATGYQTTIEMLAGPQANLGYVDYTDKMDDKQLLEMLKNAVQPNQKVVFFCDLLGGTPFKQAVLLGTELAQETAVVVGCNVGALLEILPRLSQMASASELADQLVRLSKEQASHFELKQAGHFQADDGDGI